jgi:hypothetical protein
MSAVVSLLLQTKLSLNLSFSAAAYAVATERSPTDSEDEAIRDFPYLPLPTPLHTPPACIHPHKELVAGQSYACKQNGWTTEGRGSSETWRGGQSMELLAVASV